MKRILLVEDEVATRQLYQEVLQEAGFEVEVACDGAEGLQKALEGGFSLIILDVMLPKKDGLELIGELNRGEPKAPNGGVLFLSNLEHDSIIKAGIGAGAIEFLVKSNIDPGQLVEKVKSLVK